jgi:hypothetical protein
MIGNIYPFRAKRPKYLKKWLKGYKYSDFNEYNANIDHVHQMAEQADITVCAWGGNHKGIPEWINNIPNLHYLELCKDSVTPKHPLGNLSKDLRPKYIEWYAGITN